MNKENNKREKNLVLFREQQRINIIQAAESVFFKNGLYNSTMKIIASEAEISRQTLYKYFSTMDEIVYEVQINIIDMLDIEIKSKIKDNDTSINKIKSIFETIIKFAKQYPEKMIFTTMFDVFYRNSIPDEKLEILYKAKLQNFSLVYKIINEGQIAGEVRSDIDIKILNSIVTNAIFSMVQKFTLRGELISFEQNNVDTDSILYGLVDIFINYIQKH